MSRFPSDHPSSLKSRSSVAAPLLRFFIRGIDMRVKMRGLLWPAWRLDDVNAPTPCVQNAERAARFRTCGPRMAGEPPLQHLGAGTISPCGVTAERARSRAGSNGCGDRTYGSNILPSTTPSNEREA